MTRPTHAADPFAAADLARPGGRGRPDDILRRLELTITHRLDGLLHGDHLGLVPGHGSELGETRAYLAGDDVRRIDWNVSARLQEPYIRATIADRELESWIVVDHSPSIEFGTAACEKADLALAAAAAIGFLTDHTGNRIGAVLLDPGKERVFPARGGRRHLQSILHALVTAESSDDGSAVDLGAALARLAPTLRRRGLVVVISDFLDAGDWERSLRVLGTRHEVLAVEVLDPRELELPSVGRLSLVDPETGRTHKVDTSAQRLRERYAEAAAAQRAEIAGAIRRAGAGHLQLRTDRDWVHDLVQYVARRRLRAAGPQAIRVSR
jgi:uncharacterized protein (DUF58 family)